MTNLVKITACGSQAKLPGKNAKHLWQRYALFTWCLKLLQYFLFILQFYVVLPVFQKSNVIWSNIYTSLFTIMVAENKKSKRLNK